MKSKEKHYRVADFGMVQLPHGVLCAGDFGEALFEDEDSPFIAALHPARGSTVSSTVLIERYTAANFKMAETQTIVDFMAARDRLKGAGILVELG